MHTYNVHHVLEGSRRMLEVGQLLSCPTFELQSSITAREIGDPRMDPGVHRYDQRTLSERIGAGEAPLDMEENTMLAVFDRLVQLEIGWQDRYMLSQTVYTCLYIMDLERTRKNPVLHAYCHGVHVTCRYLLQSIYDARVCSDEDVSVSTPGLHITDIHDDDMIETISYLDSALGDLSCKEVLYRLKFRKLMVTLLMGILNANSRDDIKTILNICKEIQSIIEELTPVGDDVIAPGFAPTLHEADIGPVPIKDLKLRPTKEAWGIWKEFVEIVRNTCQWICKVDTWQDLRQGLDMFASQDAHGFVRSMMYRMLMHPRSNPESWVPWSPNIAMIVKEILLVEPDAAFFKTLNKLPDLEMFLNQCVIAVQGCCHVKCLNRVRQRRRSKHNILDWKNMIGHAYNAEASTDVRSWLQAHGFAWNTSFDSNVQPSDRLAPLTCWVVREATWTCMQHLLLGGSLDLYEPEEITSVYWYASYLLDYGEHMAKEYDSISINIRLGKNIHKMRGIDLNHPHVSPPAGPLRDSWVRRKMTLFFGFALGAISRAALALQAYSLTPRMKHQFSSRKEQYMQRFEFMKNISIPDFLDYPSYLEYEYHLAGIPAPPDISSEVTGPKFNKNLAFALLHKSSDYVDTCLEILLSLESLMPPSIFSRLKRSMSANKTALHLLTGMAEKTDISTEFTASWTFTPVGEFLISWEFSTIVSGLPILTLQRIHTKK
jgi:N-alpha-acetyltransferase 35, NatC auxiliary subunit